MTHICKMKSAELPRIREAFGYDPKTGVVTRLHAWRRLKAGRSTGYDNGQGYLVVRFLGKNILCTHIAWILMLNRLPLGEIDHRNGDRSDNRWGNLREVTRAVNMQNQRQARTNNRSGFLGVSPNNARWKAGIQIDGEYKHLGTFDTPKDAHEAYLKAKRQLHEGCTI